MKKLLFVVMIFLTLIACQPRAQQQQAQDDPRAAALADVRDCEKSLHSDSVLNEQKAQEMIGKYLGFANEFPQDSLTPEYLFRASEIALAINQPQQAVKYLTSVVNNHPEYQNYEMALFYLGHTEQNYLNDTASARRYYQQFLTEFPDHYMADDVRAILQNMGLSDIELVRMFEEKNR